jgi:hypothetical protein
MGQENTAKLTMVDKKPEWSFYIAWVFLTTLSIPAAFFIDLFLLRMVTSLVGDYIYVNGVRHITEDYLALYFLVPTMGLVIGAVQYGILRRTLPRMGWWAPATVCGWLLGALLTVIADRLQGRDPIDIKLAFLLLGLSIGFAQWLLLRRRLSAAGWWIAANLLGWGLLTLFSNGNAIGQYGLILVGFLPACTTAAALALLLKQTHLSNA